MNYSVTKSSIYIIIMQDILIITDVCESTKGSMSTVLVEQLPTWRKQYTSTKMRKQFEGCVLLLENG